ncbi:MAG: GNAT family N-acetyltransferase [Fibrobacter sp.]|nr:GNAT family N-acetyltransferase [Fibrobacter sp.]
MVRQRVNKSSLDFIRLQSSNKFKSFDCGDADLNDFILNRATLFDKHMLAVSYACIDINDTSRPLAYFSLANDKIATSDFASMTEFNRFRRKQGFPNEKRLKSYPAVKLCRLAVDICAKNQKLGTQVLNYIKSMFVIHNKTGCRFITVDAYLAAVPFYEKNGFRMMNLEDNDPHTRLMYFDLMDLVA